MIKLYVSLLRQYNNYTVPPLMVLFNNCNNMAKVKPSLVQYSGTVDHEIHYTRFGRTYSGQLPAEYNDRKSEAQLRQRALFKTMQQTSALYGSILQRGLTKYAHSQGQTEANEFARLNKQHFSYIDGQVHINYPALMLSYGNVPAIQITDINQDGLRVSLSFISDNDNPKARPDDVVHIYAVEPQVAICHLVDSVERQTGQAFFDLPDISEETASQVSFYLYAIVESAATACIPTLSAAEKKANKQHRNINRRVSNTIYIGQIQCNALPA